MFDSFYPLYPEQKTIIIISIIHNIAVMSFEVYSGP